MKSILITSLLVCTIAGTKVSAQEVVSAEKFGRTINVGVGIGYYGYIGHSLPVLHADVEFDVVKNFTLAPFVSYYSYQNDYYWGNPKYPYKDYYYRQTVIPMGVKGTYYFDELLNAGPKWDFYGAGSLGFALRQTTWESGYYGETAVQHGSSGLFLDAHIGTEYHVGKKAGLFLDLSTGISTFGLAIHI